MYEPAPYRPTDTPQTAPMPGWPTEPTAVVRAAEQSVVFVPDPYGRGMVAVLKEHAPPLPERTPPRDLTPGLDPTAQQLLGGGVGGGALAAGVGWGVSQVANAAAALGSSGLVWLAALLLVAKLGRPSGKGDTYIITNHNRWWGRSSTRT